MSVVKALRMVGVAVIGVMVAGCGLFFPSEEEERMFRAGHAFIGDVLVMYVPLCPGESVERVIVQDLDISGNISAESVTWDVADPLSPDALAGMVVIGNDSDYAVVSMPFQRIPEYASVWFDVLHDGTSRQITTAFALSPESYPHYSESTDPYEMEFFFGYSASDGALLTVDEMDEHGRCIDEYRF